MLWNFLGTNTGIYKCSSKAFNNTCKDAIPSENSITSTMCKVLEHILQEWKITYIGKKKGK